MQTGACSRDDPQPKFAPPIMMGYSVFISPGNMYLWRAFSDENTDMYVFIFPSEYLFRNFLDESWC